MSLTRAELTYVQSLVHRRSAIVIDDGKDYLVESRLLPLARSEGFASIGELLTKLQSQPSTTLHTKVVEAMTTNETSFFRDQHPFEALKNDVFPELRKSRSAKRALRIWSAACSTGQEAYSIAMILKESFADLAPWDVRILGTDLSLAMVARTKEGSFNQIEVNRGLPAPLLLKYFARHGTGWQIRQELRDMVECKAMNLADPLPSMPICDVVFLRNVLIYFDVPTKRAILAKVRQILAPDGFLFLGGAETTLNIDDAFRRVQSDKAVYYRLGEAGSAK